MDTYHDMTTVEVTELMHHHGYTMGWRSGDNTTLAFDKTIDNIHVQCRIDRDPNDEHKWLFRFTHLPGLQLMVSLNTGAAAFPHPKFDRFERMVFKFARACATVAEVASI